MANNESVAKAGPIHAENDHSRFAHLKTARIANSPFSGSDQSLDIALHFPRLLHFVSRFAIYLSARSLDRESSFLVNSERIRILLSLTHVSRLDPVSDHEIANRRCGHRFFHRVFLFFFCVFILYPPMHNLSTCMGGDSARVI